MQNHCFHPGNLWLSHVFTWKSMSIHEAKVLLATFSFPILWLLWALQLPWAGHPNCSIHHAFGTGLCPVSVTKWSANWQTVHNGPEKQTAMDVTICCYCNECNVTQFKCTRLCTSFGVSLLQPQSRTSQHASCFAASFHQSWRWEPVEITLNLWIDDLSSSRLWYGKPAVCRSCS